MGQLKRRFHGLHGEVRLSPDKTCQVIVACCILHNICKDRQIPCPLDGDLDDNQQNDGLSVQNGQQNDGIRYRQLFAETHFWLVGIWVKTNIHVLKYSGFFLNNINSNNNNNICIKINFIKYHIKITSCTCRWSS